MTGQKLIPFVDSDGKQHDSFFEDPRSGIIYFRKKHSGKKIKFSTRIHKSKFINAKRFANQEFDRLTGKKKTHIQNLIKEELELWLLVKESERLAYDTFNNVKRAKRQIAEFWGDELVTAITRDKMTEWYTWWAEKHPNIDMENAIKYMRNFCRYLSQKIVNNRPLLSVVPDISDPNYKTIRRRRKKKKERIFTHHELTKIIKTAETKRDQLIVLIMYTMATRVTETLEMSFGQEIILGKNPIYRWRDGQNKSDHDGYHALHPALVERLEEREWTSKQHQTNRLFFQKLDHSKALKEQQVEWADWRKRADLDWHWTPHTFRHTCLSNLFNNPKNPQALICKLYRVSLAVAIDTYIKPTKEGIALMRKAIKVDI